jgi:hypothetical protein
MNTLFTARTAMLALALGLPATAREEQKPEPHVLRVLPVGSRAPFEQELRDGVRYEVDPPEGSLPPRQLEAAAVIEPDGSGGEPGGAVREIRLRLGELSPPIEFPQPAEPRITLRDGDSAWLEASLADGRSTLLVAWRTGETWDDVGVVTLDDSATAWPADHARVVNVSPAPIGVIWNGERLGIRPGRTRLLSPPENGKAAKLQVLHPRLGGGFESLLETEIAPSSRMRRQWVVFRSDRDDARRPFQILSLAEPLRP